MASSSQWTGVWASSESRWAGKPSMLQSMGFKRVRHDWATELNWTTLNRCASTQEPSISPDLTVFSLYSDCSIDWSWNCEVSWLTTGQVIHSFVSNCIITWLIKTIECEDSKMWERKKNDIFTLIFIVALFIITIYKSRKSRNTWSNRQIWPWNVEWSMEKTNRVLPRKCTGHSKHLLPTTQEKILHMDITRWSTPKSDWLYSLQPKMEKLYIVSKNKTRS